ncbi:MAG TPA: hypothetical protein DCF66_02005, partial [Lachnospiraceae bacterium]|nr:hypothetical protein [Lachnospiraceae bacterium]
MSATISEKLNDIAAAFPGKMQLIFRTLNGAPCEVAISPDERVVSASTIKVPVFACLLDSLEEDGIPLDALHPVTKEDILDDT